MPTPSFQRLLMEDLRQVDAQRRQLRERVTRERETARLEGRSADEWKIDTLETRDLQLLAYRTDIRNQLCDLN